jgi:hypothetical protein
VTKPIKIGLWTVTAGILYAIDGAFLWTLTVGVLSVVNAGRAEVAGPYDPSTLLGAGMLLVGVLVAVGGSVIAIIGVGLKVARPAS